MSVILAPRIERSTDGGQRPLRHEHGAYVHMEVFINGPLMNKLDDWILAF
jgi:hypothetical protein